MSGAYIYRADPDFKPAPVEIAPGERAQFNQGTSRGSGDVLASLPAIGPQGKGNVLIAWDPVAQKERWRGLAGGYNHGGTLSTGGNLVFVVLNTRLLAYRADDGQQLLDFDTGMWQMGPPMTYMLDGTQYIAIAGGPSGVPQQASGGPSAGRAGATAAAVQPVHGPGERTTPSGVSHLLVLKLDGKASLPPSN